MSVNIRYPNITAHSEKEQLAQIKSYLHQLVEQLNYALPNLGSGSGTAQTAEVQGAEISYYELRSLIIQELQEVEELFEQLSDKMQSEYVSSGELSQAVNTAMEQAKESGEFDGEKGDKGDPGEDGKSAYEVAKENGFEGTEEEWIESLKGHTPVKGIDYFDGEPGLPGEDGRGIASAGINNLGQLVITYSDGFVDKVGFVIGPEGEPGEPGKDGYTPVKGVDYFTEEEVGLIATEAAGKISFTLDQNGNLYYEVEE